MLQRTWGSLRSPHAAEHCYVGLTGATCNHRREIFLIAPTRTVSFVRSSPQALVVGCESGTSRPSRTCLSLLTLLQGARDSSPRTPERLRSRGWSPYRAPDTFFGRPPLFQLLEPPSLFHPEWRVRNHTTFRTSSCLLSLPVDSFRPFPEPDAHSFPTPSSPHLADATRNLLPRSRGQLPRPRSALPVPPLRVPSHRYAASQLSRASRYLPNVVSRTRSARSFSSRLSLRAGQLGVAAVVGVASLAPRR